MAESPLDQTAGKTTRERAPQIVAARVWSPGQARYRL